jgi:DNA-binding transcriptional LysR family regulator
VLCPLQIVNDPLTMVAMLDLARLTSFVALVDSGSFTAAARALGLTKAAVSAHVRKLEDELGCALVIRNTRHVAATEAGVRLHAAGGALLVEAERVEALARQSVGLSGILRLTATNEYLTNVLAPLLASFAERHPRLRLEVSGSPSMADVVAERFDLAVRFGHAVNSALRVTMLTTFRLLPVASPALLARHGQPNHPEELPRLPWVLHRQHPNPSIWRRGAESCSVTLPSQFVTNALDTNRALAMRDVGALLGAEWRVHADVAAGSLVRLIPDWSLPAIPVYAVRPPATHTSSKVRALIAHLQEGLG